MSVIADNTVCENSLSFQKSAEAIVPAPWGRAEHQAEVENWRVREYLVNSRKLCRYSMKPTSQRIG